MVSSLFHSHLFLHYGRYGDRCFFQNPCFNLGVPHAQKIKGASLIVPLRSVTRYWKAGSVEYRRVPELAGVDLDGSRQKGRWETRVAVGKQHKPLKSID